MSFSSVQDADGETLLDSSDVEPAQMVVHSSSDQIGLEDLAATVRPDVPQAFNQNPDGFSLDISAGNPARLFQDPVSGSYYLPDGTSGHSCPECGNGYSRAETADPDNHDCEGITG